MNPAYARVAASFIGSILGNLLLDSLYQAYINRGADNQQRAAAQQAIIPADFKEPLLRNYLFALASASAWTYSNIGPNSELFFSDILTLSPALILLLTLIQLLKLAYRGASLSQLSAAAVNTLFKPLCLYFLFWQVQTIMQASSTAGAIFASLLLAAEVILFRKQLLPDFRAWRNGAANVAHRFLGGLAQAGNLYEPARAVA